MSSVCLEMGLLALNAQYVHFESISFISPLMGIAYKRPFHF